MPEELELGAVPANDPAYGDAVSDREFDSWVRRSQGETDAVLAAWDESVAFDQEIRIAAPAPFDQDILEGETIMGDGHDPATCSTCIEINRIDPLEGQRPPGFWAGLAARIRDGEELGPSGRAAVHEEFTQPMAPIGRDTISTLSERTLQHARELEPPAGYLLDALRFMGYAQEARLSPLAERLAELRRCQVARQNLEREGFVIVDCDTRPWASGLILPSDDAVAWAKREFRVPTQRETHGTDNVTLTPFSYEGFRVGDVARRAVVSGIQ